MTLNLDALKPQAATLPKSTRGRKAEPLPENIVKMVQESYTLPEGQGFTLTIPRGKEDEKGNSENVKALTAVLRRAATSLGHGLTVSVGEGNKTQVPVTFRAKEKANRRTKAERHAEAVAGYEIIFSADDFDFESLEEYVDAQEIEINDAMIEAWDNLFTETAE